MTEFPSRRSPPEPRIAFHKTEMQPILDVYGRLVMSGEARDYAIGMHKDHAIFAKTAEEHTPGVIEVECG